MNEDTGKLLVSPNEAARLLSISPRKLWDMTFTQTPGLPHLKMGRLTRYRIADLQAYLEANLKGGQHDAR
ncbi:Helix-turn-helix domain protein [Bremerella volcania]|uniref:Helix-turn-helix domain protein n=1 Tax=Bremerella volcania TaxID=2527984 RepID=A0A518C2P9_9BACT|nr:helix-turn-helix domain-containing protein [Bremerella volcania]QDU73498.1 Helix-turn-helix domain protein [Bremerella volcania]